MDLFRPNGSLLDFTKKNNSLVERVTQGDIFRIFCCFICKFVLSLIGGTFQKYFLRKTKFRGHLIYVDHYSHKSKIHFLRINIQIHDFDLFSKVVSQLMHPEVPAADICKFLWEHLVNDVRNISTSLERSEDEVLLLIHLVLSEIMIRSTISKFPDVMIYHYYYYYCCYYYYYKKKTGTSISVMSNPCYGFPGFLNNFLYLHGPVELSVAFALRATRIGTFF